MQDLRELINRWGLLEDREHIIVPIRDESGRLSLHYFLKRQFIRIDHHDGRFSDHPIEKALEATIRFPDMPLSRALALIHDETDEEPVAQTDNEQERDH